MVIGPPCGFISAIILPLFLQVAIAFPSCITFTDDDWGSLSIFKVSGMSNKFESRGQSSVTVKTFLSSCTDIFVSSLSLIYS